MCRRGWGGRWTLNQWCCCLLSWAGDWDVPCARAQEQCKGVASQQRHFTAFYLYWFPSEVCLGIRDSHWARKKDQLLSSEGQEILSDESCLLRKRDRSRGLAVHYLLERKNWKCVIKREENMKVSETEKLWLGGAKCNKNLSKRQIDEVSAVKGIIIWDSEIWFCIYSGMLYFRHQNITGIRAFFPACSQPSSKHPAELEEVLASAGRNSCGSAGSLLEILCCCQSRREGCSTGLHCNSAILGSSSKALQGCGAVSRPSPFLNDGLNY